MFWNIVAENFSLLKNGSGIFWEEAAEKR